MGDSRGGQPDLRRRRRKLAAALRTSFPDLVCTDPEFRRMALLAMPAHADTAERVAILRGALSDTDPLVRREAAEQAGHDPAAAAELIPELVSQLTSDAETSCREAAAFALGESARLPAGKPLARALESEPDALVRESLAAALGALGGARVYDAGLAALLRLVSRVPGTPGDEGPAVRRRALVALAAFDNEEAETAIRSALGDRDRYVRATAKWLLRDD